MDNQQEIEEVFRHIPRELLSIVRSIHQGTVEECQKPVSIEEKLGLMKERSVIAAKYLRNGLMLSTRNIGPDERIMQIQNMRTLGFSRGVWTIDARQGGRMVIDSWLRDPEKVHVDIFSIYYALKRRQSALCNDLDPDYANRVLVEKYNNATEAPLVSSFDSAQAGRMQFDDVTRVITMMYVAASLTDDWSDFPADGVVTFTPKWLNENWNRSVAIVRSEVERLISS